MTETQIINAKIESTMLGIEDHGFLTFWLDLNYGSCSQGFGGIALDGRNERDKDKRIFVSIEIISKILDIVGVSKWEDLPEKYIRVRQADPNGHIIEIGNILENKWLDLKDFFKDKQK